jgi:hypothetical protein
MAICSIVRKAALLPLLTAGPGALDWQAARAQRIASDRQLRSIGIIESFHGSKRRYGTILLEQALRRRAYATD